MYNNHYEIYYHNIIIEIIFELLLFVSKYGTRSIFNKLK